MALREAWPLGGVALREAWPSEVSGRRGLVRCQGGVALRSMGGMVLRGMERCTLPGIYASPTTLGRCTPLYTPPYTPCAHPVLSSMCTPSSVQMCTFGRGVEEARGACEKPLRTSHS